MLSKVSYKIDGQLNFPTKEKIWLSLRKIPREKQLLLCKKLLVLQNLVKSRVQIVTRFKVTANRHFIAESRLALFLAKVI